MIYYPILYVWSEHLRDEKKLPNAQRIKNYVSAFMKENGLVVLVLRSLCETWMLRNVLDTTKSRIKTRF